MHLSLDMIRRTDDGVLISAPRGEVLLQKARVGVSAKYLCGPLINGTAIEFAEKAKRTALEQAFAFQLPWSKNSTGGINIRDHNRFYDQTFSGPTYALETLRRWSEK